MYCSARDLARLASHFMEGKLVGEETLKTFHSEPIKKKDMMIGMESSFTKGGVNAFTSYGLAAPGYFGWTGYGGS